jgi:tetratricopeptide (TPR) repeat protein
MQRSSRVLGCSLAVLLCTFGCAAKQGAGADRPSYSITQKAGEYLRDAGEQAKKKNWDGALHTLDRMAESHINPYERAMMFMARGGVYFATDHAEEAAKSFEQAVALDAMPLKEQQNAEFDLGQLYLVMDRFDDSANTFAKWAAHSKDGDVDPQKEYVAASAFGQARRFEEALPHAQKAVDAMKGEPKEPWLQLLVSLQFELHHDAEVAAALEQMVEAFPRKDYWLQLTQTYQDMGQTEKAAKAIKSAYSAGLLTDEKDLVNMARLLVQQGDARGAAQLLDKHLRDGKISKSEEVLELLAECAVASKDVARAEAAMKAVGDDGSALLYFQLGLLYAEKGSWDKARDAAASSLAKGGPSGETRLLLGIAHYNTKRKDAALTAFGEAKKSPSTAACADLWLKQVKAGKSGQPSGCSTTDLAAALAAPEKTSTASRD